MRKTFVAYYGDNATVSVEAETKKEVFELVKGAYKVRGPRFTDSLRSKPRKYKPYKTFNDSRGEVVIGTPPEAAQQVAFLGTRAAVRNLARM